MRNILCVLLILPCLLSGQNSDKQSIMLEKKRAMLFAEYEVTVKSEMQPVIGKPTVNNSKNGDGHAFFGSGTWNKATVVSRGVEYTLDHFRYDIKSNKIQALVFSTEGPRYLELFPENIESFELEGTNFIFIDQKAFPGKRKQESKYYELLYKKEDILLVKNWHKSVRKSALEKYLTYVDANLILLVKGDELYTIRSGADFFEAFTEEELTLVKQYADNRGYAFEERIEVEIADVLAYYLSIGG